ncbi:4-hydroxy-tetrahydrodipicolinate reductase [Hyphobacterium sp.]|uniref:4-hydroxy-tetrahydrodipicolinate reductase n=1 Tax=Hyphobacterium sp. TaxID=2004662 RepID=UPI003BAA67B6
MTIKVCIAGVGGRLGSAIAREVLLDERFELASGVVRSDSGYTEQDLGEIAGAGWVGKTAVVRLEDALDGTDVVIDASTAQASGAIARRLTEMGGPALVCGVTGLGVEQTDALREASKVFPVLAARNFSIGLTLVEMLVSMAASGLPVERWDAEISETHHRDKTDAPSGTALALGEAVAKGREQILDMVAEKGRSGSNQRRMPGAIGFSSQRGGGIVGEHVVDFLSSNEVISIGHRALDRRVFALGALTATLWLIRQKPGLYAMKDVIGGQP